MRFKAAPIFIGLMCLATPLMLVWSPVFMFTKLLADLTRQRLLWPQAILSAIGKPLEAFDPVTDIRNPNARYAREVLETYEAEHGQNQLPQSRP